jgi:hypothetical protein
VAPYVWEALVDYGGTTGWAVVGAQYPVAGNVAETPFSAIGFDFVPRTVRRPDDVHTFVNSRSVAVKIRAVPLRDGLVWPLLDHVILPGERLIWCRRVVVPFSTMGGSVSVDQFETFLFGRETPAGEVALMQVWPNAEFRKFDNYHDALAIL